MDWHVTFYDDDTGYAYRVRVKRLTVGDALEADMLGDTIAKRETLTGRALLALSQSYPFVRYSTAVCERAVVTDVPTDYNETGDPVVPDDVAWEAFDLTETVFQSLPEFLVLRWQHEAIRKNPHRDPTYEALKKKWLRERLQAPNALNSSVSTTNENDSDSASSSD